MKHWITLNEPAYFASQGYAEGTWPPCRGKISEEDVQHRILAHRNIAQPFVTSKEGNPSTEPYIVAHNLIISHAAAVKIYREKYKVSTYFIINYVHTISIERMHSFIKLIDTFV